MHLDVLKCEHGPLGPPLRGGRRDILVGIEELREAFVSSDHLVKWVDLHNVKCHE